PGNAREQVEFFVCGCQRIKSLAPVGDITENEKVPSRCLPGHTEIPADHIVPQGDPVPGDHNFLMALCRAPVSGKEADNCGKHSARGLPMISVPGSQAIKRAAGLRSRILPLVSMTTIPSLIARKICGYATGSIKKSWYRKRPSARITPTHAKAKGVRSSPGTGSMDTM